MRGFDGSPWFRRASYVFVAYVAGLAAIALTWPALSVVDVGGLAILGWLPLGPFFAACVFRDADWRRDRGRPVGDDWWIYLLSAVVGAAALWYLLRRATKATADRSIGRADATGRD